MEDYSNVVKIATICSMFPGNLAINYGNLFFYPSVNDIPEDRMKQSVIIDNVIAMYDSNNDVIGSFVSCRIAPNHSKANSLSTIGEVCQLFPMGTPITLHRKSYKKVPNSNNYLEEVTSGPSKDIFDFFGDENVSADIFIKANCNCGIDITYTPYKE